MTDSFTRRCDGLAGGCAVLLGFSIPLPVFWTNLFLALTVLLWLLGGRWREKLAVVRANPVAIAALLLFGWLAVGLLYGERAPGDGWRYLNKYDNLLFVPIFVAIFADAKRRARGLQALTVALLLTLALSYAVKLGLSGGLIVGDPANPVVFKRHITHNVLMALAAFLFAELAWQRAGRARWGWGAAALLALVDTLFLVQGRTGYVIVAVLLGYLCVSRLRRRGLLAGTAALLLLFGAAYGVSDAFHSRIDVAMQQFRAWQPGRATGSSSIGERLEFYRTSVELVGEHPLFGVGTGGFSKAYAEKIRGTGMAETQNPHNEYLLVAVQTGLVGLALLLHLFWRQWREARRLSSFDEHLARALVLVVAVGCLFNSLLIDHTESLLYSWLGGLLFAGLREPT